jgi:hypothetical protein
MAHTPDNHGDTPLTKLVVSVTGMGADEHGTEPPGVDKVSITAGHEPDQFGAKGILYVPLLVTIVVISAIGLISTIFYFAVGKLPPSENANATSLAQQQKPLNERMASISSTDPNAKFSQPRLEYFKQMEHSEKDPPNLRSKQPIEYPGATYEIRPEDLRPENFIDPTSRKKILLESTVIDADKKLITIPIEDAMNLVVSKHLLPVRKEPITVATTSDGKAKLSNAGRGGPSMPVAPVVKAPAHDHKDDHKKH